MPKLCPLITSGAMGSKEGWEAILNSGKDGLECLTDQCEWWLTYDHIHRSDVCGRCIMPDIAILLFNIAKLKKG